jgi:Na+/H+ antiporter NhaD/arsenite permease-like protein
MIRCLVVLALVIIGFIFHSNLPVGVEASSVALAGAAILLLISGKKDPEEYLKDVEWNVIFFFVGLFILVQGIVQTGWINICANYIAGATNDNRALTTVILVWLSGALSAVVDNIPYVATMIPMIEHLETDMHMSRLLTEPLWWALSLGACLGGNGTLIGASANVVSAQICSKNGYPITFGQFTKYGAIITVVNLVICTLYLMLRYFW